MKTIRLVIILAVVFLARGAFADTETTADVTEKSSGATHTCERSSGCTYDPRTDINSDGGSDDDIVYWDSHGGEWRITNDINSFKNSAWKYNYDSQAYIYSKLFGYELIFIAIDKNTHQIGLYDCSSEFIERGIEKVRKATEAYELFYNTENFDKSQYFINRTL